MILNRPVSRRAMTLIELVLVMGLLATILAIDARYGMTLNFWALVLPPLSVFGLVINYLATSDDWYVWPTLVTLFGVMLVYVISILMHDGKGNPSLTGLVAWLPEPVRSSVFLWPLCFLLPVWVAVAWLGYDLPFAWLGPIVAGLALIYVGFGQLIFNGRRHLRSGRRDSHQ